MRKNIRHSTKKITERLVFFIINNPGSWTCPESRSITNNHHFKTQNNDSVTLDVYCMYTERRLYLHELTGPGFVAGLEESVGDSRLAGTSSSTDPICVDEC